MEGIGHCCVYVLRYLWTVPQARDEREAAWRMRVLWPVAVSTHEVVTFQYHSSPLFYFSPLKSTSLSGYIMKRVCCVVLGRGWLIVAQASTTADVRTHRGGSGGQQISNRGLPSPPGRRECQARLGRAAIESSRRGDVLSRSFQARPWHVVDITRLMKSSRCSENLH